MNQPGRMKGAAFVRSASSSQAVAVAIDTGTRGFS
jgi:hypothetical protein